MDDEKVVRAPLVFRALKHRMLDSSCAWRCIGTGHSANSVRWRRHAAQRWGENLCHAAGVHRHLAVAFSYLFGRVRLLLYMAEKALSTSTCDETEMH
jgi:hypothetical protein